MKIPPKLNNKAHILLSPLLAIILAGILIANCSAGPNNWVSIDQRVKIWDSVVAKQKGISLKAARFEYKISDNGLIATFEKDSFEWSIIGANAPNVMPTKYPSNWKIKDKYYDIMILDEPITDNKILPFSEHIDNVKDSPYIYVEGAPDSYEPASFIIRSGEIDLRDITIEITDLIINQKSKSTGYSNKKIPKEYVDIRVVKCWYQAGVAINDTEHKVLTPELLLHDDNIIIVDYDHQVNIIKNFKSIKDAEKLQPFTIPRRQNKQVWLTIHIADGLQAGLYSGKLKIAPQNAPVKEIAIFVNILPFKLPAPILEYGMYYEGRLSGSSVPVIEAGNKTENQMKSELIDMREHGLTNTTLWHTLSADQSHWDNEWKRFKRTLELRKNIKWPLNKPLLYLDWRMSLANNMENYRNKLNKIRSIAREFGIQDIYIYGKDEAVGKELENADKTLYKLHKDEGMKTFVAGWLPEFLDKSRYIDLVIVSGPLLHLDPMSMYEGASFKQIKNAKERGMMIWIYNNPQAGIEEPATYRRNFGLLLTKAGLDGTLNYAYQTGTCWNDFDSSKYRYHVMAYPTVDKPIPTLQWEGWRAGVTDVRYYTLLSLKKKIDHKWVEENCTGKLDDWRKKMIQELLS